MRFCLKFASHGAVTASVWRIGFAAADFVYGTFELLIDEQELLQKKPTRIKNYYTQGIILCLNMLLCTAWTKITGAFFKEKCYQNN